jgi:hypothetical protein
MLSLTLAPMMPLAGCTAAPQEEAEFLPEYLGAETAFVEGDLVNLRVAMRGARDIRDVEAYAECAVAQVALDEGFGFARHIRTMVTQSSGIWTADAVYTMSPAQPAGVRPIDAGMMLADCGQSGIPTG